MRTDQIIAKNEVEKLEKLIATAKDLNYSVDVIQILEANQSRAKYQLERKTKTLAELARGAMNVQDACNLSGVAHSLVDACQHLRENGILSTTEINEHPVVRLYVSKLMSLARYTDSMAEFGEAWDWASEHTEKQAA